MADDKFKGAAAFANFRSDSHDICRLLDERVETGDPRFGPEDYLIMATASKEIKMLRELLNKLKEPTDAMALACMVTGGEPYSGPSMPILKEIYRTMFACAWRDASEQSMPEEKL